MKIFSILSIGLLGVSGLAAAPKVTMVYGSWNPGEGGPVVTRPNPLKQPFGVDFDAKGNLYIVELGGGRVHKLTPRNIFITLSGDGSKSYKGDGGPAKAATFNGMHNVAVTPAGEVFISDSWNFCVRKIDMRGNVSTAIGTGKRGFSGDGGPLRKAAFSYTMCITMNAAHDKIYIADIQNRRIRVADLKTGKVRTLAGNGKRGVPKDGAKAIEAPLFDPRAVAPDSKGNVYILERSGHALRVVRPNGNIYTVAGTGKRGKKDGPGKQATLGAPKHICVDDADNVYIADEANDLIRKYDAKTGEVSTVLGHGKVKLDYPHGVTWEKGKLYVVDTGHNRILRID
jgi:DNA-binding beta-propeller fold protein YncE